MAEAKTGKGGAKDTGKPAGKDIKSTAKGAPKAAAKSKTPADRRRADAQARGHHRGSRLRRPRIMRRGSRNYYEEVVRPQLVAQFGYKNRFEVPCIDKIVLNMGVGEAVNDTKKATFAAADSA